MRVHRYVIEHPKTVKREQVLAKTKADLPHGCKIISCCGLYDKPEENTKIEEEKNNG